MVFFFGTVRSAQSITCLRTLALLVMIFAVGTSASRMPKAAAVAPTLHNDSNVTTVAPTPSNHSNATTIAPTPANHTNVTTIAPTPHHNTSNVTDAPTMAPTDHGKHKTSILGIISKTIAWFILIALSLLGFGSCMSNRYRIYYFFKGIWYTFLRLDCTNWILCKLRLRGDSYTPMNNSLNTVIFEQDGVSSEGLLMRENDHE